MSTRNHVPRAANEGSLGTSAKPWGGAHLQTAHVGGREIGADLAETQSDLSRRSLEPVLHFDGVTNGSRAVWALGDAGAIGKDVFSIAVDFTPTATGPILSLWNLCGSSTGNFTNCCDGSYTVNVDRLEILIRGSLSTNYRRFFINNFRANYGIRSHHICFVRGSEAATLLVNGVEATYTEDTNGTVPSLDHAIIATHLLLGARSSANLYSGPLRYRGLYNRALTAAEIAAYLKNGDTFADLAGGSQVSAITGAAANSAAPTLAFAGFSISGDDAFTATYDDANSTNRAGWVLPAVIKPGEQAIIEFDAAGVGPVVRIVYASGDNFSGTGGALQNISEGANAFLLTNNGITDADRISFLVQAVPSSGDLEITNFRMRKAGLIINPEITRTAQPVDRGPNRIRGLLTPGVTPLGGEMRPITFNQSGAGFVLGDQNIIFDGHFIDRIRVRPTTATIPNLTLRRTSSSGTVVVDTVSSGTENVWTDLPITSAARASDTAAKYHLTFSTAAEVEVEITPSRKY